MKRLAPEIMIIIVGLIMLCLVFKAIDNDKKEKSSNLYTTIQEDEK